MQLAHQKRSITPVTPLSYLCHTLVISRFIPPLFSFHIPVILLSHPCHTPFIPLSYPCHTPVVLLSYPCHHPCPRRRYPPQGGSPLLPLSLSRHDSDRVSVVSRSAVGCRGGDYPGTPQDGLRVRLRDHPHQYPTGGERGGRGWRVFESRLCGEKPLVAVSNVIHYTSPYILGRVALCYMHGCDALLQSDTLLYCTVVCSILYCTLVGYAFDSF